MAGYLGLVSGASAVTVIVAAATAARLLQRRHLSARAVPGALVMVGAAWMAAAGLGVMLARSLAVQDVFFALRIPGAAVLVTATFWYSMLYAGQTDRLTRRLAVLLTVEPAVMLALAVTSPWHPLLVRSSADLGDGRYGVEVGPVVAVHAAYCWALLAASAVLLLRGRRRAVAGDRWQYVMLLVTMSFPMAGNALSYLTASTTGFVDLTAALFLVTAGTWYAVERSRAMLRVPVSTPDVLQALGDAVVVVDAVGRVVLANPAAQAMIRSGDAALRVEGALWRDLLDVDLVAGAEPRPVRAANGAVLDVRVAAVQDAGRQPAWVVTLRDVTDLELARAELAELAVRDALTGLHNRRYLGQVIGGVVDGARTAGTPLVAAMVDLDHFKAVNDRFGHAVGDEVLSAVARAITAAVRPEDVVVRFGGEEFLVLVAGAPVDDVVERLERLRATVAEHGLRTSAGQVGVTLSVGVAVLGQALDGLARLPGDHDAPTETARLVVSGAEALLRAADDALYAAKAAGRDRVVVADPAR